MTVRAIRTKVFNEGEDLVGFVQKYVRTLTEGSIVVVTSKIVALAEGRVASLEEKEKVIRAESEWALKAKYVYLTQKDGILLANAGADASNARGKLVLLPKDSFKAAAALRSALKKSHRIKKLGVLITDSRVMPLRRGVIGVALGYAGFKGLRDYRGKKDIFGRVLRFSGVNVADSLATAAALEMGEGSERCPLAVIEEAAVQFADKSVKKELLISRKGDMYAPLFKRVR